MQELRSLLRELKNPWLAFALLFMVVLIVLLYSVPIHAQDHRHPPQHSDLHHKFYNTWMQPDNRSVSCCHDQDCAPAQSKREGDKWYSRHSDDEEWVEVPARKVETERDSPDGQSHLCKQKFLAGTYVYCFLPANGS